MGLVKKGYKISKFILFPLILLLFPLVKATRGIDLSDTLYSLGNYAFFSTKEANTWTLITFLGTVLGHILTLLPFGGTLVGMKVYTGLLTGLTAVIGYRFFLTKMPGWLAFLAEMLALGMCWAPTVILYNYLTYFLLLIACILIFRGLAGTNRTYCLFFAGLVLGVNTFVRFPNNGLEVLLIFAVWFYGIYTKKDFATVFKETLFCVIGYVISFGIIMTVMSLMYGNGTFGNMISGVLGISGANSEYTFGQMIVSILDAYLHGMKWGLYMIICILPGIPFMLLWQGKYMKARKIVYCICIAFLFFVLYKWGMFNFKYYQKESALQWGVIFLIISIVVDIWMLSSKMLNHDWKLIGCISLILILITPLGSNNHVYPVLNNLFFIAPVTVWIIYRFARWGRSYLDRTQKVPLFSLKAMVSAALIMTFIQALGIGCSYIFMDGEGHEAHDTYVGESAVLAGTKTDAIKASALTELVKYMDDAGDLSRSSSQNALNGRKILTYGNIPGVNYTLNTPSALSTTWADLGSYPIDVMESDMEALNGSDKATRPYVILSRNIVDWPDNSIKLELINRFINDNAYECVLDNALFVVYR